MSRTCRSPTSARYARARARARAGRRGVRRAPTARARPTWSRRSATSPRWAATGSPPTRRWSASAPSGRWSAPRRGTRRPAAPWSSSRSTPARPTGPGSTARTRAAPRDVLGLLRTVLFAPEDLALVKGDPGERRRFLDELLVARAPRLAGRARGLRAGAQAAQRAAEDRGDGPPGGWRQGRGPVHAGRLGRPPGPGRGRAAGRPAAAGGRACSRWSRRRTSSWRPAAGRRLLEYRSSFEGALPASRDGGLTQQLLDALQAVRKQETRARADPGRARTATSWR